MLQSRQQFREAILRKPRELCLTHTERTALELKRSNLPPVEIGRRLGYTKAGANQVVVRARNKLRVLQQIEEHLRRGELAEAVLLDLMNNVPHLYRITDYFERSSSESVVVQILLSTSDTITEKVNCVGPFTMEKIEERLKKYKLWLGMSRDEILRRGIR